MLASTGVDDRIGLVFSWDPRVKTWVKERGPDDGQPPPVPPIDDGAVQTYFLDPANGKWNGTILGIKARQISVELKDNYRAPYVGGLALPRVAEAKEPQAKRSRGPLLVGLGTVVLLIAGGAFVAQAMLGPGVTTIPAGLPQVGGSPTPSGAAAPSGAASPSASAEATSAPTTAPVGGGGPVVTAAPTPAPTPTTIRLSVRLPDGSQIFYSGPSGVAQGAEFSGIFSALLASGQGSNRTMTIYLGEPGNPQSVRVTANPDANGNYVVTIRASVPKGDQRLSVIYGITPGIHTLGTIAVR